MKKLFSLLGAALVLPLWAAPLRTQVDFVKDIKPVIEQSCIRCHSGAKPKGGLSLETSAGLLKGGVEGSDVVPGKSAESSLYKAITAAKTDDNRMPPEGEPLAKAVTDKFKTWIDGGAKWPEGVSIKPPAKDGPKVVADEKGLPVSPAEKAAVDKLEKAGVFVMRLAQNTNWLRVDFTHRGKGATDDELILLKDMPNLVELNLGGLSITDANLVHLKPLKNLVRLQLHRTKITDAGLINLEGMPKLASLNLYGTEVSDAGIQRLKDCKSLTRLYVWQTKVTENGAKQLAAAIPGIDINRGYELPPEPKKIDEIKKDEPKKDLAKKDEPKKDLAKKDEPKRDLAKKDEPKKEPNKDLAKKDEPKKELKKDEPKKTAPIDPAALERRIAELERQIAPQQMELQTLRRQLDEQFPITVFPLTFADPVQTADRLKKAYQERPGVVVEALPKLKCVAVRSNKQMANEIKDLLQRYDDEARK